MKYWAGTTDNRWFTFLSALRPDEVNFWQPSQRPPFRNLQPGTPFLFKLKAPFNHIGGGGSFLRFEVLPLSVAWDAFGEKNGAATKAGFERLIRPLMKDRGARDPVIGCTMLGNVCFFPRSEWIPAPKSWARNIVVGKTFNTEDADGKALWEYFAERCSRGAVSEAAPIDGPPRYGEPVLVAPRWGQSAFRAIVTAAYGMQCAITGETTLPTLEAAHIRPYRLNGPHSLRNALLLRADFHKLFDCGLVTVTPEYKVVVSSSIKEQWFNGKAYNRLNGELLKRIPERESDRPDPELLRWHNDNIYERLAS